MDLYSNEKLKQIRALCVFALLSTSDSVKFGIKIFAAF